MFKTWVIWMVLALSSDADSEKIPVALASPDRPFLNKDECLEGMNNAREALEIELKKVGVQNFAIIGTCVDETRHPGGFETKFL